MTFNPYPLQFEPILKERIWGGEKLRTLLNKPIASNNTGESWELSAVEGDVSIVSNGFFKGKSLTDLIESFPTQILGSDVYQRFGSTFPLLFKYLDAREDLSIQVHPNDELAKKRHNSLGKTEMWYVMQADPDAKIIVGFKQKASPADYMENLINKTLPSILNTEVAEVGDVFFLDTGTVHAIGAGLVIAEIQQTSDITYRIYDFDRKDANGNTRDLHIDLALDAINYDETHTRRPYLKTPNQSNTIVDCPYFTTSFIPLDGTQGVAKDEKSFTVYMCTEGKFQLEAAGQTYYYEKGDTVLIPASLRTFRLSGKAHVLEIYIS